MINQKYNLLIYNCDLPDFDLNQLNSTEYLNSTNYAYDKIKIIWGESNGCLSFWKPNRPSSFSILKKDMIYLVISNEIFSYNLSVQTIDNSNIVNINLPVNWQDENIYPILPSADDYVLFSGDDPNLTNINSTPIVINEVVYYGNLMKLTISKNISITTSNNNVINASIYSGYVIPGLVSIENYCQS